LIEQRVRALTAPVDGVVSNEAYVAKASGGFARWMMS
jgi:hypothetical protein